MIITTWEGVAEGPHDKCKHKRKQIGELQEDLQTMSNAMENLNGDESAYTEMIEEKEVIIISQLNQVMEKVTLEICIVFIQFLIQ